MHIALEPVGIGGDELGEARGVQQLEHGAVALADAHDVIRNRRRHAEDEGRARKLALAVNVRQRVGVIIDLHNRIGVDAVDLAVGALTDDLAAVDGDAAVGLRDRHHLGEARHLENLIHVGGGVDHLHAGEALAQAQQHAQARGGNVLQLAQIERERTSGIIAERGGGLLLRLGGVRAGDPAGELQNGHAVFGFHGN